ncbi:hypothetical protein BJ322DRAFT_1015414 [Thelephora terrestris]|uniref:Uncharacterized protein n=1 Tax=Thelephora terrestris TaxID=56493 RepID=A0A9P6H2Z1_9AGAM|nr:hypothetical protein BJ322DRAFT_1015414 [Thelephora terrestris]
MKNTVAKEEAGAYNPECGQCCSVAGFRVHLEGTACDAWNKSATEVFVGGFLQAYPTYNVADGSGRDMVRMKSQAALESMIRQYRKLRIPQTLDELKGQRDHKNRQERKRKLFNRRWETTFLYPSLERHRPLLEELGPAGMSSDEEESVGLSRKYGVIEPAWRSELVTSWLRIFDALHWHARRGGGYGDQRGSTPRMRESSDKISNSGRFVSRLPRNAYNEMWLNSQSHAENTVQPGPPAQYFHDRRTLE